MGLFTLARLITLGVTLLFSIIVMGIAADVLSLTEEYYDSYYIFTALAVATAVLSLLFITPMLVIDFLRKGAFTSMIIVEASVLSFLWILWLATAAYAAWTDGQVFAGYSCSDFSTLVSQACQEFKAVEAFGFLTWIILMGYTVTLIVFAFIGHSRGNRTWTSTLSEVSFLSYSGGAGPATTKEAAGGQHAYPPYNPNAPSGTPYASVPQGSPGPQNAQMSVAHPGTPQV